MQTREDTVNKVLVEIETEDINNVPQEENRTVNALIAAHDGIKSKENLVQKEDAFNIILPETLLKIFSYLTPEAIATIVFLTNKRFHDTAKFNLFWMEKFERHFKEIYPLILKKYNNRFITTNLIDINWYHEFLMTYKDQYQGIYQPVRAMFSKAKEGDYESCYDEDGKPITIPIAWFKLTDENKKTFLAWAQELNNKEMMQEENNDQKEQVLTYQYLLNYFYQLQKEECFTENDPNDLEKNQTINTIKNDVLGRTILFWAVACHQSLEEIRFLLSKGSQLNEICLSNERCLPIHIAAEQGKLDLVTLFLKMNPALLNVTNSNGMTPLMYAAKEGHLSLLKDLLKKDGINLQAVTHDLAPLHNGKNALHLAAEYGHSECAKVLENAGLDATQTAADMQFLPIHYAARVGNVELVQWLAEKYPHTIDISDAHGQTPFLWAAANRHLSVVEYLLKKGNINLLANSHGFGVTNHGEGRTALHWAAKKGHIEVMMALLKAGADATIPTIYLHELPIHLATHENQLHAIRVLIEHQPELMHVPDVNGETPLIHAASKGYLSIVQYLLSIDKENVGFTLKNNAGKTALHLAAENGHSEVVATLLKAGADARIKVSNRQFQSIHLAVRECHLDAVLAHLLHQPELLNETDAFGYTPLMLAAVHGYFKIVVYLLSKIKEGLDLNAKTHHVEDDNQNGKTALYLAADERYSEIVDILLQHGATLDQTKPINKIGLSKPVKDEIERRENVMNNIEQRENMIIEQGESMIIDQGESMIHYGNLPSLSIFNTLSRRSLLHNRLTVSVESSDDEDDDEEEEYVHEDVLRRIGNGLN